MQVKEFTKERFFELFPLFGKNSPEMGSDIFAASKVVDFPAGKQLYTEGDACAGISFLLEGEVRVYKISAGGREITLYEIGPGETCILNASCLISNISYPANAVSLSPGRILLLPSDEFMRLVEKHGQMRGLVLSVLAKRLTDVMTLVEEVAFQRMDERLMDYLIEKSEDGLLRVTHQKIASDLGTSREVISRLLKEFERQGELSLSRNMIRLKENDNPV
ncbi:MAG TPA: Crp/Fnr family transcriptional regulator [Nitrospirota bacterium]